MEVMELNGGWISKLVTKIGRKIIKKKTGVDPAIDLNLFQVEKTDTGVGLSIAANVHLAQEDYDKLVKMLLSKL